MATYLLSGQFVTSGLCLESADGSYKAQIQFISMAPDPEMLGLTVVHGMTYVWQSPPAPVAEAGGLFLILRDTGALELWAGTPANPQILGWSLQPPSKAGFGPFFAELDSTPAFKVYAGTPSQPGALISQFALPS